MRTGIALCGMCNTSEADSAMDTNVGVEDFGGLSATLGVACPRAVEVDVPICEMESSGTTSSVASWLNRRITVASETTDGVVVHCGTGGVSNAPDKCRPWLRARLSLRRCGRVPVLLASCSARNLASSPRMKASTSRYGNFAKMSCSNCAHCALSSRSAVVLAMSASRSWGVML